MQIPLLLEIKYYAVCNLRNVQHWYDHTVEFQGRFL